MGVSRSFNQTTIGRKLCLIHYAALAEPLDKPIILQNSAVESLCIRIKEPRFDTITSNNRHSFLNSMITIISTEMTSTSTSTQQTVLARQVVARATFDNTSHLAHLTVATVDHCKSSESALLDKCWKKANWIGSLLTVGIAAASDEGILEAAEKSNECNSTDASAIGGVFVSGDVVGGGDEGDLAVVDGSNRLWNNLSTGDDFVGGWGCWRNTGISSKSTIEATHVRICLAGETLGTARL
jgi:hypothetical protein